VSVNPVQYQSILLMLPLSILVLLIWIYLRFLHGDFWRIGRTQLPAESDASPPRNVAVVIPARNEADFIARAIGSLLRQQFAGHLHVFVVDDNSSDGTANAARAAAKISGAAQKVSVIAGSELPAEWKGKVWAMQQGWEAARAWTPLAAGGATGVQPDYVLLTDADVEHGPGALAQLIAHAERGAFDLASFMVRLRCQTLAEKFLIPAFVYFFFLLYPPERIADSRSRIAGAAGGCMLLRREALERIGGFQSIRGEIIDDCALARQVKRSGGRLWLGVTNETRSMRGYETLSNIRDMIARTAFNQLRHSWSLLAVCFLGMLLAFVAPLAFAFSTKGLAGWLAMAACILMFATYVPALRLYRVNPLAAVTLPFAAIFYMYATVVSALRYSLGKGGEWKGRAQDAD
jgi:hopene-associated glycosyltransferase HpnB